MSNKAKDPVLADAARMLRKASRLIDEFAVTDDATTYSNADVVSRVRLQQKRIIEAMANINAAVARILPHQK